MPRRTPSQGQFSQGQWTPQERSDGTFSNLSSKAMHDVSVHPSFPSVPRPEESSDLIAPLERFRAGQNLVSVLNSPLMRDTDNVLAGMVRNIWQYDEDGDGEVPLELKPLRYEGETSAIRRYLRSTSRRLQNWTYIDYSSGEHAFHADPQETRESLDECYDTVPTHYFDPGFQVSDTAFFDAISARADSAMLQEELAQYLDTVEVNIFNQVALRSDDFFTAILTVQDLYVKLGYLCLLVEKSKNELQKLHDHSIRASLSIVRDKRRQLNLVRLQKHLEYMSTVCNSIQTIKVLVSSGDYSYAMDLITLTRSILEGELKDLHCVRQFSHKLKETEIVLCKILVEDFATLAVTESPDVQHESDSNLVQIVLCVGRLGGMKSILDAYVATATERLRTLINKTVLHHVCTGIAEEERPQLNLADDTLGQPFVLQRLIEMNHKSYMNLISQLYSSMVEFMRSIHTNMNVIIASLEENSASAPCEGSRNEIQNQWAPSASELSSFESKFQELVTDVCKAMHSKCMALFSIRDPGSTYSDVLAMKAISDMTMQFVEVTESITNNVYYEWRSLLLRQAKAFLLQVHERSIIQMNASLETEVWDKVHVPRKYQKLVDRSMLSVVASVSSKEGEDLGFDFQRRNSAMEMLSMLRSVKWDSDASTVSIPDVNEQASAPDALLISDRKFHVVNSTLHLLESISGYVDCAILLDFVSGEALHRLVQLLGNFNSKCCQLVLGAGALHSAKLKSITARNLALSAQSLDAIICLVPLIWETLSDHLPEKQQHLLAELNRVTSDFSDHRDEVYDKLAKILCDISKSQLGKLIGDCKNVMRRGETASFLSSEDHGDETNISKRFTDVAKQTTHMSRILTPLLPRQSRDLILQTAAVRVSKVIDKYFGTIRSLCQEINPAIRQELKMYLSMQVEYLSKHYASLKIMTDEANVVLLKWSVR